MAYEAATTDLKDVNMIDFFHLEAHGETAVNYNRDIEVFPVVKRIIEKITGKEAEYMSPTDMGVNRAGFSIIDDQACRNAASQEIIRRYLISLCDYKKGIIDEDDVAKSKLLLDELNLKVEDRAPVLPAREYSEFKRSSDPKYENVIVMALELPDGKIVTGRSSRRMVAAASAVLNAIKYLSGMSDEIHLISPAVLETIQHLKTDILRHEKSSLNCEEVLSALTISATTNPSAQVAVEKLLLLNGCKAHCTAILSDRDSQTLMDIGIDSTSDPEYLTNNLYFN
jgi:uncharacterized protein (UPF0371 family)